MGMLLVPVLLKAAADGEDLQDHPAEIFPHFLNAPLLNQQGIPYVCLYTI